MGRDLVASEPAVVFPVLRQIVVDAGQQRLAVARFDQGRRSRTAGLGTLAEGPDLVRPLSREFRMEGGIVPHLRHRHEVSDLRKEFSPALMGEEVSGRASLDRATSRELVHELRIGIAAGAEVGMPGQAFCVRLIEVKREARFPILVHERDRRLHLKAPQGLSEFLGSKQGASGSSRRHCCVRTARQRVKPVFQDEGSGERHQPPTHQVTSRNLTLRQRLYDFGPVLSGILRLALPNPGSILADEHCTLLKLTNPAMLNICLA